MVKALYIHIPYCIKKCPYCDFNSYAGTNGINKNFIAALKEEIFLRSGEMGLYQIKSIFFGGGTPTIFLPDEISDILNFCLKRFLIASDCEISIEANPGTINHEYLEILQKNGFNRLSIGCQSFNDNLLKKIGRIHNCRDNFESIITAQKAGFENISLDLMFGLPAQTLEVWKETLRSALQFKPTHLSIYNMIVEQNTPYNDQLQRGELSLPSEELQLAMYETAIEELSQNAYEHYEISNFAKEGYECLHNKVYWNNNEYLGVGPGAASFLNGIRTKNVLLPDKYIHTILNKKELPVYEIEKLEHKKRIGETIMLGLRMLGGINLYDFEKKFGKILNSEFADKIKRLCNEQLLEYDGRRMKLTHRGLLYSNEVFMEFI